MSAWQTQLPTQQCPRGLRGARTQTGAAARSGTRPVYLPEESACQVQQAGCPTSLWLAESRKAFPLTFPKPFSSLPSPGSTESVTWQTSSSLLAFANHIMTLANLDNVPAASRSDQQSPSPSWAEKDTSSSSLEGRAASLPTQTITRAAFSAMLAGNLRLNCTKAKVYHPKLSNSSILPSHFSIPSLQLVSHCQESSRRVYPHITPAGRQQRAPHNHQCDLYTSIMLPS